MDKVLVGWLLTLGVGFPLLGIMLEELSTILKKQKHPLAGAIKKIQQYLLPPLAILLVMRELLKISHTENSARLVESLTWVAVILSGVSLINAILTTKTPEKSFQIKVPNLFFQLLRTVVALGIIYHLLTKVWGIDISELTTAVGVGSIAVGLALQDTLSNLVSGLLILVAKPFKVGDWIEFGGTKGRVIDQNWWSVTLENRGWEKTIVVPNSVLAQANIENYGTTGFWKKIDFGFSYDDPPNKVLEVTKTLGAGIEDLLDPNVYPMIDSFGDFSINYQLWFKREPDRKGLKIHNILMSRIYYLAKREGFTIPYPIQVEFPLGENRQLPSKIPQVAENRQPEMINYLGSLPYFLTANNNQIEQLASKSQFLIYGQGELITQEGKVNAGIYAVYRGRLKSYLKDNLGEIQTDKELNQGDVFGEMAIYPGEVSPVTTVALNDVELIVIPAAEIVRLIQTNPNFSSETIRFIEERKKAINITKGISHAPPFYPVNGSKAAGQ